MTFSYGTRFMLVYIFSATAIVKGLPCLTFNPLVTPSDQPHKQKDERLVLEVL